MYVLENKPSYLDDLSVCLKTNHLYLDDNKHGCFKTNHNIVLHEKDPSSQSTNTEMEALLSVQFPVEM